MIRSLGISAILATLANPATAFCDALMALQGQGGTMTLPHSDRVVECETSLVLSVGTQTQCGWPFAYRDAAATAAFEQLNDAVAACLGPAADVTQDQSVNHPDFYDLRVYRFDGREIGVSLKDKAELRETYVFLRVARADR